MFNTSTSSCAKLSSLSSLTTLVRVAIEFRLLFAMFSLVRRIFLYSSSYLEQMDRRKFLSHTSMNRFCSILKKFGAFLLSMLDWTHGKLILLVWTNGKLMVPKCQFHPKLADAKMSVIVLLTAKLWFQ